MTFPVILPHEYNYINTIGITELAHMYRQTLALNCTPKLMMTDIITQIDALKYAAAALLSQEREQEIRLEVLLTKLEENQSEPGDDDQDCENLEAIIAKLKKELEEIKEEREECRNKLEDLHTKN